MPKLKSTDISFLRLVLRSHADSEGWCIVSSIVWPLVRDFRHQELIEISRNNPACPLCHGSGEYIAWGDPHPMTRCGCRGLTGKVRLSEKGKIIAEYLV